MGLNIKNDAVVSLVKKLSRREGVDMTEAIKRAVQQRLEQLDRGKRTQSERRLQRMTDIERELRALPIRDPRPWRELLEYDELGGLQ